jgi:catalase (peroxidase I)
MLHLLHLLFLLPDWKQNEGLEVALTLLDPVKKQFGKGLSWADLIVLAGRCHVSQ